MNCELNWNVISLFLMGGKVEMELIPFGEVNWNEFPFLK